MAFSDPPGRVKNIFIFKNIFLVRTHLHGPLEPMVELVVQGTAEKAVAQVLQKGTEGLRPVGIFYCNTIESD